MATFQSECLRMPTCRCSFVPNLCWFSYTLAVISWYAFSFHYLCRNDLYYSHLKIRFFFCFTLYSAYSRVGRGLRQSVSIKTPRFSTFRRILETLRSGTQRHALFHYQGEAKWKKMLFYFLEAIEPTTSSVYSHTLLL